MDQVVWEPLANTLHFKSDELLKQICFILKPTDDCKPIERGSGAHADKVPLAESTKPSSPG